MCVCVRPSVRPSRLWHLLISRRPDHLEGWILACRQVEPYATLSWGRRPQLALCARCLGHNAMSRPSVRPSVTNVTSANILEPGPLRGLNFGTQTDWTLGYTFLRPKASVCVLRSALGAQRDITSLLISQSLDHLEG